MDKAPVSALKLCQTRASLVSNVDSRANETYTGQGGRYEMPAPYSSLRRDSDGLSGVQGQSPAGAYKDLPANPATQDDVSTQGEQRTCGAWAVVTECSSGEHHFAKKLVCGKEWCSVCRENNSAAHKRRQARVLQTKDEKTHKVKPRLTLIKQLGYLVIEFPEICRHVGQRGLDPDVDAGQFVKGWCYSKEDLNVSTETIVEVLAGKRCGRRGRVGGYFGRGLGRWHWFGEKRPGKYNPHFNALVDFESLFEQVRERVQPAIDAYKLELSIRRQTKKVRKALWGVECYEHGRSGYMPKPLLDLIQADLRAALNVPDLIVHYSYFDKPGQMVQKARYLTRATFTDHDWDAYMAEELFNFRNMRWWGKWSGKPAWSLCDAEKEGEDVEGLEVVAKLQSGICPDCGKPLKALYRNRKGKLVCWTRPVDSVYLQLWGAQEISGTGYYRIPDKEWTGYNFSPDKLLSSEWRARPGGPVARARRHLENQLAVGRWWPTDSGDGPGGNVRSV